MRKRLYILLALIVLLVCGNFNPSWGYSQESAWWTHFAFHFAHGNVFHLAANTLVALSIVLFRNDKWYLWIVSYLAATACSFIIYASNTTVGLSATLFVYYGIIFLKDGAQIKPLLFTICFMAFSLLFKNNVSIGLHALSLIIGATIGSSISMFKELKNKEKIYGKGT